ncbi:hypothetical protein HS088_TW07G00147 [Tripterygium wilfordii]|uniref:Uncharacterized protein n=1 Tax=Tripterygium wilfordii TaxID=458696 RepID=A0A7J7DE27_TRIWF|nr:hypothetical protein HS088_TW07G00147 [Tripterygium wilfordii]
MSSVIATKFGVIRRKLMSNSQMLVWSSYKSLAIAGLVFLYPLYTVLANHLCSQSSAVTIASFKHKWGSSETVESQTNISHLVFGISGSTNRWKNRRAYIESWWQPNITRGFIFLDQPPNEFLPWPSTSPPFRVSEDIARYKQYHHHKMPNAVRLARVVLETLGEENRGVRWYIMADDDTVFFVDNLVEVLAKYDHRKYFYVGMNSECVSSNLAHSFDMAFGGAGYAMSFPLAEAVARNIDSCIMRYSTLLWSDQILQSCVADLGVSLTKEKGFHQVIIFPNYLCNNWDRKI